MHGKRPGTPPISLEPPGNGTQDTMTERRKELEIKEFQDLIARVYRDKDASRGELGTFAWMVEEVGELSRALRADDQDSLKEEFADVMAWLFSLANLRDVDMEAAAEKYAAGCPKCRRIPCSCVE